MRKYIIFFTLICSSIFIEAQNNLVFNRVLNFSVPNAGVTVPDGKAWKIENGSSNVWLSLTTTNTPYGDDLNSEDFPQQFQIGDITDKPIWISEGTLLKNYSSQAFISILEFDVVPISSSSGSSSGGGGVSADGLVFEEAITQTLTQTGTLNSNTRSFGEIVVPENRILKIISVSTYTLSTSTGGTSNEGNGWVYIGDEIFMPASSNYIGARNRFFPSGTYIAKVDWSTQSMPNRLVVNAILYSKP